MLKVKFSHILISLLILLCGCGVFKSTTKIDTSTDSTASKSETVNLAEYESLNADIPASYIKSITTPSGMKIELRDSLSEDGRREAADDGPEPKVTDSTEEPDEGSISISYESEKEQRDSTVTKTKKEEQKSVAKETEIETSWSWLTWLFIGIAIALALIVAALMFLK